VPYSTELAKLAIGERSTGKPSHRSTLAPVTLSSQWQNLHFPSLAFKERVGEVQAHNTVNLVQSEARVNVK